MIIIKINMVETIKKHYLAIILAMLVGGLALFPQISAIMLTDNWQGIYRETNEDMLYYLARGKDVIDGYSFIANPYIFEYKNKQPMQVWLPDYLLAKPLALLHIEINQGYLFYDFLLTFVLIILTYSIIFLLTNSKITSILATSYLYLSLFLFAFNRTPSPQLNFIFWLLLYLFWLKFLEKKSFIYAASIGLIFGLLFYIYPYYWIYYLIFIFIFLFCQVILKQHIEIKKYALALLIGLFISIPYWFFMIKCSSLPYYEETLFRVAMIYSHFPVGRKTVMWGGIVVLILYFFYKKKIIKLNEQTLLLFCGILSASIATNQQIITGRNVQFASHLWMINVFCCIFALAYVFSFLFKRIKTKNFQLVIILFLSLCILYRPLVYIVDTFMYQKEYNKIEIKRQSYAPIFEWLKKNTSPEEVVFANEKLSCLIPIYTLNNVFYSRNASLHFMPDKELQQRFVINNFWSIFNEDSVKNQYNLYLRGAYYSTKYDDNQNRNKIRRLFFLPLKNYDFVPKDDVSNFIKLVDEIQKGNFENELKKFKIDYLIQDKNEDNGWPINELKFLKLVYEANNITIFKVN
jgi:hypothetical protein